MIADTSFLVDLIQGRRKAGTKLQKLAQRGIPVDLTVITVFELWSGLYQSGNYQKEYRKIVETIRQKRILGFDTKTAKAAGEIEGKLRKKGLKIQAEDAMIAGIALIHNERLLTRNIKHFSFIPKLKLEKY